MKTLYIVRHAKSSWENAELDDHDRPLLEKGKKRTKKIIDFLLEKNIKVDLIMSSSAVRAYETARFLAHALKYPVDDIKVERQIYHANADKLQNLFFDIPPACDSLMIVGHNPTFTNFANYFLNDKIDWMPTSAVVSISFQTDSWENIFKANHELNFFVAPKMLKKS